MNSGAVDESCFRAFSQIRSRVAGQKLGTQIMKGNVLWMTAVFGEVDYVRTDHRNIHSLHFLFSSVVFHLLRHSFHFDCHYSYPHSFLPTFLKVRSTYKLRESPCIYYDILS